MILVFISKNIILYFDLITELEEIMLEIQVRGGFFISFFLRMWRVKELETSDWTFREEQQKPVMMISSHLEIDQQYLGLVPFLELPKQYIRVLAQCRLSHLRELPQNLLTFQVRISEVIRFQSVHIHNCQHYFLPIYHQCSL